MLAIIFVILLVIIYAVGITHIHDKSKALGVGLAVLSLLGMPVIALPGIILAVGLGWSGGKIV